jgi:FkbH-like protein
VVIEWSDLDPRLGLRTTGGWPPDDLRDLVGTATSRLNALDRSLSATAGGAPIAVALPTLPLPPCFRCPTYQAAPEALALRHAVSAFAASLAAVPGLRVVDVASLDAASPPGGRPDPARDLQAGFPYRVEHADVLADRLAALLRPAVPRKGLITDLDHTLWHGIAGEDGVDALSWHLDRGTHAFALYQQMLASLAELGVLIGVASRNDPTVVERALARSDLLVPREVLFPVEAGWGPKSEAVARILNAWNVGPQDVVFIDDSPMERAEVAAAFPDLECLAFPGDEDGVPTFLNALRDRFGKDAVSPEDRLRRTSLQGLPARSVGTEDFLATAEAELQVSWNRPDARCLELINKTNQFNLNGRRLDEAAWHHRLADPDTFLLAVTYRDRFGPLGKIAVVLGRHTPTGPVVDAWVMSCRAFARRIEHQTLRALLEALAVDAISLAFRPTPRNGPMRDFLAAVTQRAPTDDVVIQRDEFEARCPRCYGKVTCDERIARATGSLLLHSVPGSAG